MTNNLQHPVITRLRAYGYDSEPEYCCICGAELDDEPRDPWDFGYYKCWDCMKEGEYEEMET